MNELIISVNIVAFVLNMHFMIRDYKRDKLFYSIWSALFGIASLCVVFYYLPEIFK